MEMKMSSCRPVGMRGQQYEPVLTENDGNPPEVLGVVVGPKSPVREEPSHKGTIKQYFTNVDNLRDAIENDGSRNKKRGRENDEVQLANKKHKSTIIPPKKPDLEGDSLTMGGPNSVLREEPKKRKYNSRRNKKIIQIKGQKMLKDYWKSQGNLQLHTKD